MRQIPALSSTGMYANLSRPRTVDVLNSTNPQLGLLDSRFQALQILTQVQQGLDNQQDNYRKRVVDFTNAVQSTRQTAGSLLKAKADVFQAKSVTSSDGAVSGIAKSAAQPVQHNVTISALASAQRNEGQKFSASSVSQVKSGSYTLGFTRGKEAEKQISVMVSLTDNNEQALGKFAAAINKGELGLKAEVKKAAGQVYLDIQAEKTGIQNAFAVRDISGDSAAKFKLDNVAQQAKDAEYTVDGVGSHSDQNQVSIAGGDVTLQLHKVTDAPVKVAVVRNEIQTTQLVEKMVDAYNQLREILQTEDAFTTRAQRLTKNLPGVLQDRGRQELRNIGITLEAGTGRLNLDQARLNKALREEPDKVERALAGAAGLAKGIDKWARNIQVNPVSAYIRPDSMLEGLDYRSKQLGSSALPSFPGLTAGLLVDMLA